MSIKNNITSLQSLLEQVNALPEAENLDEELTTQSTLLSEQDAKIAELADILAGKAAGSGNGYEEVDALITMTLSECTNSRVSSIGNFGFFYANNLTTVNFPNCTNIGTSAFAQCSKLNSVSFPKCTTIGSNAFTYCFSLISASFPVCTNINTWAFYSCKSLTYANFPNCTTIGSCAFSICSNLTSVNFPKCTTIGSSAFRNCCNLSQFYLTGSSVCKLSNSNAFSSTPYAGYSASFSGTPYIYVPQSLLTSYQTATNWTYFSSYFSAVEGGT